MYRIILVLSFFFLIISSSTVSLSQDSRNRRDGNWWITVEREFKLRYLIGFFDGMDLGNDFSYWGMSKSSSSNCIEEINESYNNYCQKYFSKVTNDQLVDGIDSLYSDYKNRRIMVTNAVWIVVNGITGTPQDKLDKLIESWRRNAVPEK